MRKFSIDVYNEQYLDGMTAIYNAETEFEPHIASLTPDRFVELVKKKSYFDPSGLFVAIYPPLIRFCRSN